MKKSFSLMVVLGSTVAPAAGAADYSANAGWASEYVFRGIPQNDSSASFGLDVEQGSFHAGTWAADVGQGAEVDLYLGFGRTVKGLSYSVGGTGYFYTDNFDDTYKELNLGLGYAFVSLDVAFGKWAAFAAPSQDYTFTSLTAEHSGFHATWGTFSRDFDGDYLEVGYGRQVGPVDVGLSWIYGNSRLLGGDSDNSLVLTIGKTFSFSK